MKFMGSKRTMLLNGLGQALADEVPKHQRFFDLFTGSGAVSWHVAQQHDTAVVAGDLQQFSVALANSVLRRTSVAETTVLHRWTADAIAAAEASDIYREAKRLQRDLETLDTDISALSAAARSLCARSKQPLVGAYGGYYFSPLQAILLDAFRRTLPSSDDHGATALGSLIWTASRCAAAPGHTAQPFKPNETAGPYLAEAWRRDPCQHVRQSFETIGAIVSRQQGTAITQDAVSLAGDLREGDLAFLDPPYSGVHYSRFYHVLETLVANEPFEVAGSGRYPPPEMRPRSDFSVPTAAASAFDRLFAAVAAGGASAIVTFPTGSASNGVSGDLVIELASKHFRIEALKVSGRFSTLGGNTRHRAARKEADELILTLRPN